MEYDLLFTFILQEDWKSSIKSGVFSPPGLKEEGVIRCITDDRLEMYANEQFKGDEQILLIVIDPLRIQAPLKEEKIDGIKYPLICGSISIDCVIDKIPLSKSKDGQYSISVKHFD